MTRDVNRKESRREYSRCKRNKGTRAELKVRASTKEEEEAEAEEDGRDMGRKGEGPGEEQ